MVWRLFAAALVLAITVFLSGVYYFARHDQVQEPVTPHTVAAMPAVFNGFTERWNQECRGEHIRCLPLSDLPDNLTWHTGLDEPEIGDPRAVKGGSVRLRAMPPFPQTLRAFGAGSDNYFNYSAIDNVWLPLVALHPHTNKPIPGLADRWATSADGQTVYYHLDPQATYSDGLPVKAADFLLNICLRTSEHAGDPYWANLFRTKYRAITLYGDSVIALSLAAPTPLAPYVAAVDFHPAHPGFYRDFNASFLERYRWQAHPNTGAYIVDTARMRYGESLTLKRVKNWWAKDRKYYRYTCNVDRIEHFFVALDTKALEMFRRGDLHMLSGQHNDVWEEGLERAPVRQGYISRYSIRADYPCPPYGLYLNCAASLLQNIHVRQGLAHAVHMDFVIHALFHGQVAALKSYMDGFGDLTMPVSPPVYNRHLAAACFARAGFDISGSDGILRNAAGQRLELELSFADVSPTMRNVCTLIRQEARKCGIDLKLDPLSSPVCSRKVFEKRHQIVLWAWPLATPFPKLYNTFHSQLAFDPQGRTISNTDNIFSIADPELDAALTAERNAADLPALQQALHQAQQRINELCIWIPGWKYTRTDIAAWRWIRWPQAPTDFCLPKVFAPMESHLYWVDEQEKKRTLNARRHKRILPPEYREIN